MSELQEPEVLRTVLETLETGVYVVDRDRKIVFWNEGAERISGYLRQDVLGRACRSDILVHRDEVGQVLCGSGCPVAETMLDGQPREARVYMKHKAGYRVPVLVRAVPVRNRRGCIIGAAESFNEVSETLERDPLHELMELYGCLDGKTGVPHQSFTYSRLRERLMILQGHQLPFSIFLFEVQHEDIFLATHGRDATDMALRSLVHTLRNTLSPFDFLGRGRGDCLVAILDREASDLEEVKQRVQMLASLSEIEWWGDSLRVSVDMGVAHARTGDTVESLLERAEQALRATSESRDSNPGDSR
jgi:PAS domain S-box-containing protein/diguanylate cyclase (GGDEF)-like protein